MYKIIKITDTEIYIGASDGTFQVVPRNSVAFEPIMLGQEVICYDRNGEKIVILAVQPQQTSFSKLKSFLMHNKMLIGIIAILLIVVISLLLNGQEKPVVSNSNSDKMEQSISTTNSTTNKINKVIDTDKSRYIEPNYDKWNHEELAEGTKIKISGKVIQEQSGSGFHILRVAMNGDSNKVVYVEIDNENYKKVIAEDDEITLYGLANGRTTYETVLKSSLTIPLMEGLMYEIGSTELEESDKPEVIFDQDGLKIEQIGARKFRFYNNRPETVKLRTDSIDVNGQIVSEYNFSGLVIEDLRTGQFKEGELRDDEGVMKAGKTVRITLKIMDDNYREITEIEITLDLDKDVPKT
ncbi:hypothetical protein [Streptococcus himalayensis]|uniref:Uncharacterized protein n=1 Tax=Streptococcus himalayensis TaxID=1888195 RepID=A0A917EF82_9STRE|nr:hypothetical protein [Streptococcus himalayensis]GGE32239.1 hypothetical protein GCM10011510_11940 [Streptococcus himalayensis]